MQEHVWHIVIEQNPDRLSFQRTGYLGLERT